MEPATVQVDERGLFEGDTHGGVPGHAYVMGPIHVNIPRLW